MPATIVNTPTARTYGLMSATCSTSWRRISPNDASAGIGMPKNDLTWVEAIITAAPAEKPMITVCETKLTSVPRRAMPITSWKIPVSSVTVSTSPI
jgi:hypothetical protein